MDYFGGTIGSQEISARLCDTVVVTFYYCFALLKKDKLFFFPHFWQVGDLSSPTRDKTWAHSCESSKS